MAIGLVSIQAANLFEVVIPDLFGFFVERGQLFAGVEKNVDRMAVDTTFAGRQVLYTLNALSIDYLILNFYPAHIFGTLWSRQLV